jgi:hypothetical protein
MSHLVRVALLLVLLVAVFLFTRSISTTVSIDFIGLSHDDNPREWAMLPVVNQASTTCAECHEATNASWETSAHVTVSCENCHGPTKTHIEKARNHEEAPLAIADARDLCLTCHAALSSRPPDFPQVDTAEHGVLLKGTGTSCASCHNPHDPGIPPVITHTLEGRPDCLACHGPDEWDPVRPSHADVTVDDCLKCHNPKEET